MQLFIATFVVLFLAVIGMAVGVLISNKRLQGSCGGLSAIGIEKSCGCEKPCERKKKKMAQNNQKIEFRR